MGAGDSAPSSRPRVSARAVAHLVGQVSVIPTYTAVTGKSADEASLNSIIVRYPQTEWLSFLARIQTMLAGFRINEHEYRMRVFWGAVGPRVRVAIDRYSTATAKKGARVGLFYERQLATLQQLAILHAPENGPAKLETDAGKDDLGLALLMVAELMMRRGGDESDPNHNLECRIHDQIRMSLLPVPTYAGRAFEFYELASHHDGRQRARLHSRWACDRDS